MNHNKAKIKKPNFFMIGAPRSGTTAMATYLREHPDIFFSEPKEPNFFNQDLSLSFADRYTNDYQEYLELFADAEDQKAIGEGSVMYLFSKEAIPKILEFNSKARFIVMARNPIEMFSSLYHRWHNFNLKEDASTPEEAWNLQSERAEGKKLPEYCPEPKVLQYGELCSLGWQMERLYSLVPKERVLFILFDDFVKDPKSAYESVLEFLEIPSDNRNNFPRINESAKAKFSVMAKFSKWLRALKRKLKIRHDFGVSETIKSINKVSVPKQEFSDDFRRELLEYFREDIKKLSRVTERDLSHWLT